MKKNDLTNGNIRKILLTLAFPIMGSSFLQMIYGLVDMFWVGKIGSDAVAAVGTASFFINLGYAVNSMVVVGAGIKISHVIGAKDLEKTKEYIKAACTVNFLMAIVFILPIIIFSKNLVSFFNLTSEVEKMAQTYLVVAGIGLIFKFFNFLYSRILNSYGESKLPFKINSVGVILNIILDPIFIFVFNWGVFGAALATILAEGINTCLFLMKSRDYFKLESYISKNWDKMKEMMILGSPIALQRVLFTGFGITIAKIISQWGPDAIAAQKIGIQIESITFMTVAGLQGAVGSFIGQNYGAKQQSRIKEGYKTAIYISTLIGIFTTLIFILLPESLVRIFVQKKETIDIAVDYMRIIGLSQLFMCYEIVTNGAFSGVGKPKVPSLISIIFTSLRIPLAFILSKDKYFGLNGVWISIALSSVIKGIISPVMFRKYLNIGADKNEFNKKSS
ncbi:MAG: MATE family efflux transporter [Cetobacterium sp.]|uniref:MATE family efflux transporter n=1 Tax=Cetobacterium sp. TaxID=2071632 RepID=UPI003F3487DB